MGYWGTGPMDGDAPLDLRHGVAEATATPLRVALNLEDDGEVFAAAHIAMDLTESDALGFDYLMFMASAPKRLATLIRRRVRAVKIAEEWGSTHERERVRGELLARLDALETKFRSSFGK